MGCKDFPQLLKCRDYEKESHKCIEDVLSKSCEESNKCGSLECSYKKGEDKGPHSNPQSPGKKFKALYIQKPNRAWSYRRTGPVTPVMMSGLPANRANMRPPKLDKIRVSEIPI